MNQSSKRILIVDDEPMNLDLLEDILEDHGYELLKAEDGQIALDILEQDHNFDVILLDRMMPNMDGIECLRKIKDNEKLEDIPIIMQTAASSQEQISEGITAGVFYYMTKPIEESIVLATIDSAILSKKSKDSLIAGIKKYKGTIELMQKSTFEFRTMEDVKNISDLLSNGYPNPDKVAVGLLEMLANAVEHGNLGISYEEKKSLLMRGKLMEEISKRLDSPENINKRGFVKFEKLSDKINLHIKDEGTGFSWAEYMSLHPERATDPNGRGIAMANMTSFDSIEYKGTGNEVVCVVNLNS